MINIEDPLTVLPIPDFPYEVKLDFSRNNVVKLLFREEDNIKKTFINDEFLVLDVDNHEIVGLKSTAQLGGDIIPDIPALYHKLNNNDKYKTTRKYSLGSAATLFDEINKVY